jgi:glycerol-3-phosphate acyltransferase PlsY
VELAAALVVAYLLGSIPTSYFVVYLTAGVNVRTVGDGNPGTMNVWENVGFWSGLLVALGDIGKGAAAVGVAYSMGFGDIEAIAAAFAAVIGHDFSIFLRLRGGNGTAAAVGGMLALVPLAVLPLIAIAIAVYQVSTRKRLIGLVGLLMIPVVAYWLGYEQAKIAGAILLLLSVALKVVRSEGLRPARARSSRPR